MQSVRRTSLIAQVTEQLKEDIRSGRWPIGTRIPTEPELAELTGTGRNTLREAVQALVHAGMLERRQGSGTYVIATSEVGSTLEKYFAEAAERDVLELRHGLEATAAALAAHRRDESDIAKLERLLEERNRLWPTDRSAAIAADVQLHRAIVAASHNAVYLEFYDSLLGRIEASTRSRTDRIDGWYNDEHSELVQAIADGDAERAAKTTRCFLDTLLADYPQR
ncbi:MULTISPECIES: FadR/GntR family transcriptional regulator [Nocardia]|uniref:FadR/GntR family transcriptional regulator n=1 Tax=Nocardia TaxID=1817 RepID=UPI001892E0BE|nr:MULTISPECIES: FadR/GntR family transcriptional regulator [Nocardia]MBF6350877.1 FadR family transcriptional regulator [Nocardia flavorosea]